VTTGIVKQHDRAYPLIVEASYASDTNELLNIPPGTPAFFTMTKEGATTPKVNRQSATVVSSALGVVTLQYDWGVSDTDTPGLYRGEFEVDLSGKSLTIPTPGYVTILVDPDLS
jgi:hypothetical protein